MDTAPFETYSSHPRRFEAHLEHASARLFVHRTRRFKTAAVKIRLIEHLNERASARALLTGLLRRGTKRSPDLRAITCRLENLFGAGMTLDLVRIGERQATDCGVQFVHARGRGFENIMGEALQFQRELLFEPKLDSGGFPETEFEQERRNLTAAIRAVADDKASYAHQRMVEVAFAGEPYARADHGSLEDVAALDRSGVADYHHRRLCEIAPTVFAIGDFDERDLERLTEFTRGLSGPRITPTSDAVVVPPQYPAGEVVERVDSSQSHLLIAHRFDPRDRSRDQAVALSVAAAVLGGGAHSLLFREVRERAALCYSTHASIDRQKGFMICYAGIARHAFEQARHLIRAQVDRMRCGEFHADALESARASLAHSVRTAFDSPWRALDFASRSDATGWPIDGDTYLAAIERCDSAAVIAAAEQFKETICYLAAGEDDAAPRE